MVGIARLLQLTLGVTAVNAFFPWIPDVSCDDCKPGSKRAVDSRSQTPKAITLELLRSLPPPEDAATRSARALRVAGRLATKYSQPAPVVASRTVPKVRARTNTYSVVAPATPTAKNSVGVFQDGTDYSYFVQAQFGSSSKAMYMLLDSGAGTTWVMGTDCKSDACLTHNTFGAKDSTTFKLTGANFSINYGSGSVKGDVAEDTIKLAGLENQMVFGVAKETSKDFTHFPFDGILGLARGKGVTDNFMAVMSDSKKLPANLFAVSLSRHSEVTNAGSITFGATDSTKYLGEIGYTSVAADRPGVWAIPMDDMGYDGKQAGVKGRYAYIDTGTSFAFGPPTDVALLHTLIPGAVTRDNVTYFVPCDSDSEITVTFSGKTYTISSKDWLSVNSGGTCTSNFYGIEVMKGSWLLGDVFIKNVYTVFDADNARIGFASKPVAVEAPEPTSAASPPSTANGGETTVVDGVTVTLPPNAPSPISPAIGQSGQDGDSVPTTTSSSPGEQLESNRLISIICIVAVVVMMG